MTPLAERLRPQTLDDFVGQEHLLGAGKPLRKALESTKRVVLGWEVGMSS